MAWNSKLTTALGHAGAAYTEAWLEWQQEVARFVGTRIDEDRVVQESLSECRDLHDMAKAQQDWAMRAAKDYISEATRLTQIASRFAQIAVTPLYGAARSGRQESKAAE
jgi:hypothetical protein